MIHLALLMTICSLVIYIYGLLSFFTVIAFFIISICILIFAIHRLKVGMTLKQDAIDATETKHFFAGSYFRSHTATDGTMWFRYDDICHHIAVRNPENIMAYKYRQHFRKVNPHVDSWYVHPKLLLGLPLHNTDVALIRFLEKRASMEKDAAEKRNNETGNGREEKNRAVARGVGASPKRPLYVRFWNGDLGIIQTAIIGAVMSYLALKAIGYFYPADEAFVYHYRRAAFVFLLSIITSASLLYACGHGIILAALHRMASGKSAWIGIVTCMAGTGIIVLALSPLVASYEQYSFVEWLSIFADSDEKADIRFEPSSHSLVITGGLGFGTTIKLREVLEKSPDVKRVALDSPGGRVAEGFAIHDIVKHMGLDTYVPDFCASSCVMIFVAGNNRYVGNKAFIGLHRSGLHWDDRDDGINEADRKNIEIMRAAGIQEWLIQRGMKPSIHGIYEPSVQEMLDGNLATGLY